MGTGRQGAHLIGHHREAAPLFPRPRRLDGRVEGQQVGLIRYPLDLVHQHPDALRLVGQRHRRTEGVLGLGGQLGDALLGIPQLPVGVQAVHLGLGYLAIRLLDVAGYLVGRCRHLGDGRRHLLGLDILLGDVGARLTGGRFEVHGQVLQGEGRVLHSPQHGPDPGLQQLDVEVRDGLGLIARVDEPGQAVVLAGQLAQVTGGADQLVAIEQDKPGQRQQHKQRPPDAQQTEATPQHRQQPEQGHPMAHPAAQGDTGAALPPLARLQPGVGAGGNGLELGFGAAAHRLVATDPALLEDGGDIGIHPVVTAILAAILDHAAPGLALFQLAPEIGKGRLWHVRMAHHVVMLTYHLRLAVARHPAEIFIRVGDDTPHIRGGDQLLMGGKIYFFINEMTLRLTHGTRLLC
ncbi:hypothetical protein D3C85_874190 [compost metagenome]